MSKDIEVCREQLAALTRRTTDKIALDILLEKLPGVLKTQESAGVVTEEALDRLVGGLHSKAIEFRRASNATRGRQAEFLKGYAAALDSAATQIKALYEIPF